jgi:hypothetical protein
VEVFGAQTSVELDLVLTTAIYFVFHRCGFVRIVILSKTRLVRLKPPVGGGIRFFSQVPTQAPQFAYPRVGLVISSSAHCEFVIFDLEKRTRRRCAHTIFSVFS